MYQAECGELYSGTFEAGVCLWIQYLSGSWVTTDWVRHERLRLLVYDFSVTRAGLAVR
jgi:hypothetical protein